MYSTVRLPSGKLIDLSRFVALLGDRNSSQGNYRLSLAGLTETISIDAEDADFISQKLELKTSEYANNCWDKESQLTKNKPLMSLIEQWQKDKAVNVATEEEAREYRDIQQALKRKI